MSSIIKCDKLLKIYTNKNKDIFESAGNNAYFNLIEGQFGIIYDDYNTDIEVLRKWKADYPKMTIYNVARLRKTIKIDDKIYFSKKMSESLYTPVCYFSKLELIDRDELYFLKNCGNNKGINIYSYDELQNLNINFDNSVIQKCCFRNPDLYNNRIYKIRQLVLLCNKSVYLHKESRFTMSEIDFNDKNLVNRRNKYIVSARKNVIYGLRNNIENYNLIFENIKLAVKDFKKYYIDEINSLDKNEYTILGFDLVVDNKKNVKIIEISHRCNYKHPKSQICVEFIKDMILLLTSNSLEKTKLLEV